MAFTTPRFEFGYVGDGRFKNGVHIRRKPAVSDAPSAGVATTVTAPRGGTDYGDPVCLARAAAFDIYAAVGSPPNANVEPRFLVRAGTDEVLYCDGGEAAAWVLA